ncbi:hypothetical protein SAMN04488055_1318 [Chitinophaga niabensis]|uniref:Uncharacterized protein n=1 Tax=Chitinophaga niabensis TaxID=536979 RepID=A0A1N6E5J3_9BACT|nr:hypothetical protein SAMN04488055_1318 [Chitinophaga niabensis]
MNNRKGHGKDVPPNKTHVLIYFIQQGSTAVEGTSFYEYYDNLKWKNPQGITLTNWKTAAWQWIWYL